MEDTRVLQYHHNKPQFLHPVKKIYITLTVPSFKVSGLKLRADRRLPINVKLETLKLYPDRHATLNLEL